MGLNQDDDVLVVPKRDPREQELRKKFREERHKLTLFQQPLATLYHFFFELVHLCKQLLRWVVDRRVPVAGSLIGVTVSWLILKAIQPELAADVADTTWVFVFWVFLGVLSSVGLGTGLHTFILFLGPFTARVIIAAHACRTVNFKPPFHSTVTSSWSSIECDLPEGTDIESLPELSFWVILAKVRWPALFFGFGTAVGELPPYFMARAARLAGSSFDDDEFEDELADSLSESDGDDLLSRSKRFIHYLVKKAGFWGILACASFPNPLFDLAGITCGHFLVPFWTFFGATAIGKSLIKLHIQMACMVLLLSDVFFNFLLTMVKSVPLLGSTLKAFLEAQRKNVYKRFAGKPGDMANSPAANIFAMIFGLFVIAMISFFAISIVNYAAQRDKQRRDKEQIARIMKSG